MATLEQTVAPGAPITVHGPDADYPGTVVHLSTSGRWLWFVYEGRSRPLKGTAKLMPDGVWREHYRMSPITVGSRFAWRERPVLPAPAACTDDELDAWVEALEPQLLRTAWYPMEYMAIPSIIARAEALVAELRSREGAAPSEAASETTRKAEEAAAKRRRERLAACRTRIEGCLARRRRKPWLDVKLL